MPRRHAASSRQWKPAAKSRNLHWAIYIYKTFIQLTFSSAGAWVKMMEVETASSITFDTISSMMEAKDWEVAIELEL